MGLLFKQVVLIKLRFGPKVKTKQRGNVGAWAWDKTQALGEESQRMG
jgi:hypothetical protein